MSELGRCGRVWGREKTHKWPPPFPALLPTHIWCSFPFSLRWMHDTSGVPKTLTFNHRFSFGADSSRQLTDRSGPNHFTLPDLLTWAPGVACSIEWLPQTSPAYGEWAEG